MSFTVDELRITAWPPAPPAGIKTGTVQQGILVEHLPTGTEIIVCKERHQYQNKALALKALGVILSA
jgi:protein subunit release factor A